ncbi:MAG: nitronate monooxygenase [Gammaproteobacteria bacterium]|nr:nitronate monooxygenase [Gammaproteobacteria bacterium]
MTLLNLKYPILQAPVGSVASPRLAANVCNAGAMGSLALTWEQPQNAARLVTKLRAQTAGLFFVNYVLAFPAKSLDAALEAGAPVVTFSWGQPGKLADRVHRSDARVGIQVGNLDGAKQALDNQADFIICQGVEAGGHVQSTTALSTLLAQVVEISDAIPVVAAGGLANGGDLYRAMRQGAAAIMLGTRFVATSESRAHPLYKQALIDAQPGDSVYTLCYDGSWPYAAHRVLRNATLNDWESAGCPQAGQRPGEGEIVASDNDGYVLRRYDDDPPLATMEGEILDCCLYAGTGCGDIDDLPDAAGLISRIWSEYRALSDADGEATAARSHQSPGHMKWDNDE